MDQARLDELNARGLAMAGSRLGSQFEIYRPTGADYSSAGSSISTVYLAYTGEASLAFKRSLLPEKPFVTLMADPRLFETSDYLVGVETLFVCRKDPFRPALGILCNNTLDVLSASLAAEAGTNNYGGLSTASSVTIAKGWPASLLVKTKTEADPTKLPSDTKSAYYTALLPHLPDVIITAGMRLQDAGSNIYQIVSSEKSAFGWLISAALQTS